MHSASHLLACAILIPSIHGRPSVLPVNLPSFDFSPFRITRPEPDPDHPRAGWCSSGLCPGQGVFPGYYSQRSFFSNVESTPGDGEYKIVSGAPPIDFLGFSTLIPPFVTKERLCTVDFISDDLEVQGSGVVQIMAG